MKVSAKGIYMHVIIILATVATILAKPLMHQALNKCDHGGKRNVCNVTLNQNSVQLHQ
jgi:hypothetical protein